MSGLSERDHLPAKHPLRCASCGNRATTTIVLEGFRTPVCLRHYNMWQTPTFVDAAACGEQVPGGRCVMPAGHDGPHGQVGLR